MDLESQVQDLKYSGFFRGRVVKNDDPKLEGRIGIFVPAIITELPNHLEAPAPQTSAIPDNVFENQAELGLNLTVQEDNYIWARPAAWMVENGGTAKNQGGSFRVPRVGTMVLVFFEGADPNRPYWMPFTLTIDGDVVAGRELGKSPNTAETAANWKDPKKRVEINILAEHDNGNIVAIDNNENSNSFVVRWSNGHSLVISHAAESGIVLQTGKGHMVQLDENSGQIRLRTQTNGSSIVLGNDGTISIKASSRIKLEAPRIDLN